MFIDTMRKSCGTRTLSNLHLWKHKVRDILEEDRVAQWVFSDTTEGQLLSNGEKLAKYIRTNNLGEIIESASALNPNSCHVTKVWVWTPRPLDPRAISNVPLLPRVGFFKRIRRMIGVLT